MKRIFLKKTIPANAADAREPGSVPRLGDPLQKEIVTYSSILAWKNLMDRGAWWAVAHGVTKSRT